jgi:phytoene dehydrogenase-like protein
VQLVVHLSTDRLPPYPNAREGDWNGLQSHVDTVEQLTRGFLAAEDRRVPEQPPTYCFMPSVYDDSLAPAGRHTLPVSPRPGWPATPSPVAGLFTCGASTAPWAASRGARATAAALELLKRA